MLLFALLIENAGLVPAVAGGRLSRRWVLRACTFGRRCCLAAALAAGMSLLFVGLLDQPFALLRGF